MLEHAIRMKERVGSANKLRNYDTDGYIKRAGCICFRTNHAKEVSDFVLQLLHISGTSSYRCEIKWMYLKTSWSWQQLYILRNRGHSLLKWSWKAQKGKTARDGEHIIDMLIFLELLRHLVECKCCKTILAVHGLWARWSELSVGSNLFLCITFNSVRRALLEHSIMPNIFVYSQQNVCFQLF